VSITEIPDAPISALRTDSELWQMGFHERVALEGILGDVKPGLAIEIGSSRGGSLERLVAHSQEVHAFDFAPPPAEVTPENVTFHIGDSHKLVPKLLRRLAEQGRNVDFVLVDGDHSTEGVKCDITDLLESPALRRSAIVIHDSMNQTVRAGLAQVNYESYDKVVYVELDFIPGHMFRQPSLRHELWGGFGLVLVNEDRSYDHPIHQDRYYEAHELLVGARALIVGRERKNGREQGTLEQLTGEVALLSEELARCEAELSSIWTSRSWRFTRPLRAAVQLVRRRRTARGRATSSS
jgi:Methyltransferase domain